MHRILFAAFLILTTSSTAWAISDLQLTIAPERPITTDELTITVSFHNTGSRLEIDPPEVEGERITIRIEERSCMVGCDEGRFELDFPLGPLPNGRYTVRVVSNGGEVLLSEVVPVDEIFDSQQRPEVILEPQAPTDNDRVQLLIALDVDSALTRAELGIVERRGRLIELTLFTRSSGEEPGDPRLHVVPVDLGALRAGSYRVLVHLIEPTGLTEPPDPRLVAVLDFEVADAPDQVLLLDRFETRVEWTDFLGNSGPGLPVPDPTSESTLFTFFSPGNWELLVKVLDGCAINGHLWVFTAAATNVEYTITVTDTLTGEVWTYTNALGVNSPAVTDVRAFARCP